MMKMIMEFSQIKGIDASHVDVLGLERCKMYPGMVEHHGPDSRHGRRACQGARRAAEGGAENDGCKCGPNCSCNPCTCK
ncbi:hypothetical protein U9M48_020747 [Paspalum notatum var. saurae]|uniref:Metallothionein-like protein n=1 Tax=Paspalum notatum var. saurae TaxID=547442 RepID=A0AAQ3TFP9_PASNO